jgi:3-oxoacyl-[acyl-carrier-protein] synthase-3
MSDSKKVSIIGTGSYMPEKILTNADLQKIVDTTDEWIMTRTGIKERRTVVDGEATSDLAVRAARNALEVAKLSPEDLDVIIIGTVTPDHVFPSTACYVQTKLGTRQIPAFDISAACSGFLYALTTGYQFIANGPYKNALVIGAECLTRITDYTDRNTCILFGDGAGAVILQKSDTGHEILYTNVAADGSGADMMHMPAGGSKNPASHKTVDDKHHYIQLRGREVFKFAVLKMTQQIKEAMAKTHLKIEDIKLIVPHQVNMRILEAAAEKIGISMDRLVINIEKRGNSSAASLPMALDEVARSGRLQKGDNIILVAFGGGLTWGSTVIRW